VIGPASVLAFIAAVGDAVPSDSVRAGASAAGLGWVVSSACAPKAGVASSVVINATSSITAVGTCPSEGGRGQVTDSHCAATSAQPWMSSDDAIAARQRVR
jgi:hypothetical protein